MVCHVVQVGWQAAPSTVNTETHGNRSGARASAQASRQAPTDPPSSKLMTGQISQGRPVDSSERRRFLISRKDYDACSLVAESSLSFLLSKKRQIIASRASLPPSLGSCNACLLQRHFSISSWQCCGRVVSHRFHQFGRVFSGCFHLECF